MASIPISTTLQDKDGTYDRICNAKPITVGSGDPLNRTGARSSGVSGNALHPHAPLSFDGSRLTKEERYFIYKMPL